jgi:hypothetical protein
MSKLDMDFGAALGLAALMSSRRRIRSSDPVEPTPAQLAAAERRKWNEEVEAKQAQKKQTKALRKAEKR